MFETPKERAEKAKALKKLMSKWLSVQATEQKAALLLSKNPEIKMSGKRASGKCKPFSGKS
jgi:hypothetical protein